MSNKLIKTSCNKDIRYTNYRYTNTAELEMARQGQCIMKLNGRSRKMAKSVNKLIKRTSDLCDRISTLEGIHQIPSPTCRNIQDDIPMQLIVVPVRYKKLLNDNTQYRAYKNYVVNPRTGEPVLGHPMAKPGYHIFYTDVPAGRVLDISNWSDVVLI